MKIKKVSKKLIICILIFLVMFNFMVAPIGNLDIVYADTITGDDVISSVSDETLGTEGAEEIDDADLESLATDSTSTTTTEATIALEEAFAGAINGLAGILTWVPRVLVLAAGGILQIVGYVVLDSAGDDGTSSALALTPFDIFFNKFALTNINIFQTDDVEEGSLVYNIRTTIAGVYQIVWLFSMVCLLIMLIVSGMRMAISTKPDERANWKHIITDWFCSALLVICMTFIVVGIIYLNNLVVDILATAVSDLYDMSSFTESLLYSALIEDRFHYGLGECYSVLFIDVPNLYIWIFIYKTFLYSNIFNSNISNYAFNISYK